MFLMNVLSSIKGINRLKVKEYLIPICFLKVTIMGKTDIHKNSIS